MIIWEDWKHAHQGNSADHCIAGPLADALRDGLSQFSGYNARVRESSTVHAVGVTWLVGSIFLPALRCRTPIHGFSLNVLTPTLIPVNCCRCLRRLWREQEQSSR